LDHFRDSHHPLASGLGLHVAGSLIHLLLVIALIVAVINLITGRRTV